MPIMHDFPQRTKMVPAAQFYFFDFLPLSDSNLHCPGAERDHSAGNADIDPVGVGP
jgi:hypothetical protein